MMRLVIVILDLNHCDLLGWNELWRLLALFLGCRRRVGGMWCCTTTGCCAGGTADSWESEGLWHLVKALTGGMWSDDPYFITKVSEVKDSTRTAPCNQLHVPSNASPPEGCYCLHVPSNASPPEGWWTPRALQC